MRKNFLTIDLSHILYKKLLIFLKRYLFSFFNILYIISILNILLGRTSFQYQKVILS